MLPFSLTATADAPGLIVVMLNDWAVTATELYCSLSPSVPPAKISGEVELSRFVGRRYRPMPAVAHVEQQSARARRSCRCCRCRTAGAADDLIRGRGQGQRAGADFVDRQQLNRRRRKSLEMTPENPAGLVLSEPMVSVAARETVVGDIPAPESEPMLWLYPFRMSMAPLPIETADRRGDDIGGRGFDCPAVDRGAAGIVVQVRRADGDGVDPVAQRQRAAADLGQREFSRAVPSAPL